MGCLTCHFMLWPLVYCNEISCVQTHLATSHAAAVSPFCIRALLSFRLDLMNTASQMSNTHSLQLIDLSQIRSNTSLLQTLERGLADLGLGDKLCSSLVENRKNMRSGLGMLEKQFGVSWMASLTLALIVSVLESGLSIVSQAWW